MLNIKPDEIYTPNEISEMNLYLTKTKITKKQMILRLIRNEKIKATNLGSDKQKRYVVRGKDLLEFINQNKKNERKTSNS